MVAEEKGKMGLGLKSVFWGEDIKSIQTYILFPERGNKQIWNKHVWNGKESRNQVWEAWLVGWLQVSIKVASSGEKICR